MRHGSCRATTLPAAPSKLPGVSAGALSRGPGAPEVVLLPVAPGFRLPAVGHVVAPGALQAGPLALPGLILAARTLQSGPARSACPDAGDIGRQKRHRVYDLHLAVPEELPVFGGKRVEALGA